MDENPFRLDDGGDLTLLRRTLEDKGYTRSALADLVSPGEGTRPLDTTLDVAAAIRRTAGSAPLHTLVRLFVLARAVPEEAVRDALTPVDTDTLVAVGLLHRGEAGFRAETALLPFADLILARDFWSAVTGTPNPANYVPGVGPATLAVANLTVRRRVESALDMGTGSGFQTLLAAGHAERVIGTDVNPRALNIAAFNARLNGIGNVELRRGSVYEPVRDCRFDLVVSNPPFVISPRAEYCYRDSGMAGDSISEQVIHNAPQFLREGGYCTVLFNWHHKDQSDWADRPKQWLDSTGCDAWILCSDHADPVGYASNWLREAGIAGSDRYARLLDEWLAYYERLGIGTISSGAVILRRRSGRANWIRAERSPPGGASGPASDQIERVFAAQEFLESLPEERSLLEHSFALTQDHELQYFLSAEDGGWAVRRAELRQTHGFAFAGEVDRLVSTILARCDGQHRLADLVARVAADFHADYEPSARAAAELVRKLLQSGFLSVAGGRPPAS